MIGMRVLAVVAIAALIGCQAPTAGPAGTTARSEGAVDLSATVTQYRRDAVRRVVQIKVSNDGTTPVTVHQIQLRSDGFAVVEPTAKDTDLAPGLRVDLPVPYGPAVCDRRAPTASAAAVVSTGGERRDISIPIATTDGLLQRILHTECEQLRLAEAVTVAFDDTWTPATAGGKRVLRTAITLRRGREAEPIALTQVGGNVIFTVRAEPPDALPVEMVARENGAALPIAVNASRCDPHAVAESKRSYTFPVWVQLGESEPTFTTVVAGDEGARALDELVQQTCF